jgi:hypothetical protein
MKKLTVLLFLILLLACEKPQYCWKCDQLTMVIFKEKDPIPHLAILEYCGKTEEDIAKLIIDGTWKSTLISQGDTVIYVTTTRCTKL